MKGSLTISRVNSGDGTDYIRVRLRRDGDKPADALLIEASFEAFCRALVGEGEVTVEVFTLGEAHSRKL